MGRRILKYINEHIIDLDREWDGGAYQIRKESNGEVVDMEWSDGVSAFNLDKVLNLIKEKGSVTKAELLDECL